MMGNCNYWLRSLSHGINFYSTRKPETAKDGYLYLILNGQAFRISESSERNYSYPIGPNNIKEIAAVLESFGLETSGTCEGYKCIIEGTPQDPAAHRVIFFIGDRLYNIKNFNGWEIREACAREIIRQLRKELKPGLIRWCSNGYFNMKNETEPAPVQIKPVEENVPKQSYFEIPGHQVKEIIANKVNDILSNKLVKSGQISIFDLIS